MKKANTKEEKKNQLQSEHQEQDSRYTLMLLPKNMRLFLPSIFY